MLHNRKTLFFKVVQFEMCNNIASDWATSKVSVSWHSFIVAFPFSDMDTYKNKLFIVL